MTYPPSVQRSARNLPAVLASITLSLILAACGGGGGGGSGEASTPTPTVPTPSANLANGTVTGFGSVIVDGAEIEDANAPVVSENIDGSNAKVGLKLGQRVRVEHDGKGTASQVSVDAAVIGAASALDTANGAFKAAGQWVKVNSDSAAGPVTIFGGGYSGFSDIVATDLVEVHGSAVYSSARAAYEIQATRIEKKADISFVRVMGKVASLNTTTKTFAINGLVVNYATANLVPTTATLSNDQFVVIWGGKDNLSAVAGTPTLKANRVRVVRGAISDIVTGSVAQLGGLVSQYSAGTLELDGIKVSLSSSTKTTPVGKTPSNGSYILVKGTFNDRGVLVATDIHIRESSTSDDTARIKLSGVISSLTDSHSFVVRGVPVDASGATLESSCTGVTLAEGMFASVVATAQVGTDVVKATRLACVGASQMPTLAMRELKGTASSVDATSKTFKLTPSGKTAITVLWNDTTAFTGVSTTTLSNTEVKVEGYLNASGTLVAREIHAAGVAEHDAYDKPASGSELGKGWSKYKNRK
jgi:hypothetical protein